MKTILVPTDLSDVSEYALDVAVEIAKKQVKLGMSTQSVFENMCLELIKG